MECGHFVLFLVVKTSFALLLNGVLKPYADFIIFRYNTPIKHIPDPLRTVFHQKIFYLSTTYQRINYGPHRTSCQDRPLVSR